MTKTNITSQLKPSLDEIISVTMLFPIHDERREQMWNLIIRDQDLTEQFVSKVKGNTNHHGESETTRAV